MSTEKTPANSQAEVALVRAARQGDREALRQLLADNWNWLKGLAYNILGNAADVEETLQNVCVLVLKKIDTVREPERFKGWLATVARNEALAFRAKRSRLRVGLDQLLGAEQLASPTPPALDRLAQEEEHQRLLAAVALLPEKYREVFVLKYMQDMPYSKIAEILQLPVTTVQIRLVRGRRMIFNRLTGQPTNKVPRT